MKKRIGLLLGALLLCFFSNAQTATGTIYGTIWNADSTDVVPGATIWIETASGKIGARAGLDGKYTLDALKPGTYIVKSTAIGRGEMVYQNIQVHPDGLTKLEVVLKNDNMLDPVVINGNGIKLETDIISYRIPTTDIKKSPYIRDPLALLSGTASDIQMPEGSNQPIIRGSRPGDAVYFVDGVKMTDMTSLPGVAIGGIQAYTGGIPAKYGDTTGGVIMVESVSYFDLYYAWLAQQ
ncbi:MAG: TonB-dependent receptor [Crocinitomicaceae bacterium]|nr:TonB-dependent receptor [Crocinitomicaceae bacterium]